MAKLNKNEASLLRRLMEDQGWDIIKRLADARILEVSSQPVEGANEFETLRMLHKNQGGAELMAQFFDDLEKGAFS